MDGSAGVDRGHKAKMEGETHRGSLKGRNTRGRGHRQSTDAVYSALRTFLHTQPSNCC